jgi:hypothetical protein
MDAEILNRIDDHPRQRVGRLAVGSSRGVALAVAPRDAGASTLDAPIVVADRRGRPCR